MLFQEFLDRKRLIAIKFGEDSKIQDANANHKDGLGEWLSRKVPSYLMPEHAASTYEPQRAIGPEISNWLLNQPETFNFGDYEIDFSGDDIDCEPESKNQHKRFRTDEEQWDLETRIARLKETGLHHHPEHRHA